MAQKKYLVILTILLILIIFTINNGYSFAKGMKKIDTTKIIDLVNSKSREKNIILFSRDSCPQCVEYFPTIKKALKELPKDYNIYYYDTDLNRKNTDFDKVCQDLNVQYVPTIIFIEGGGVKLNIQGEQLSDKNQIVNSIISQLPNK